MNKLLLDLWKKFFEIITQRRWSSTGKNNNHRFPSRLDFLFTKHTSIYCRANEKDAKANTKTKNTGSVCVTLSLFLKMCTSFFSLRHNGLFDHFAVVYVVINN